jgi:hypothetical protein
MSDYPIVECINGNKYVVDDINYRQLSNGAIFDMNANIIVGMDINGTMITQENASEYSKKRWRQGRIAANLGLRRLNNSDSALDAWSDIVERQAIQALGEGRDATNAAKFVGNATGLTPGNVDIRELDAAKETDNVRIELPAVVVRQLLDYIERKRQNETQDPPDIIEG